MSILEWFPLLSESAIAQNLSQNQNSYIFLAYLFLSVVIRKAAYLAAFFMSCMLFEASFFDPLSEAELYLLTFAIYSYVVFVMPCNRAVIFACVNMLLLSITLAYDAYHYGVNGFYGEAKTIIYSNIEILALCSHSFLIAALIPYRRISDFIGRMSDAFVRFSVNSVNFAIL